MTATGEAGRVTSVPGRCATAATALDGRKRRRSGCRPARPRPAPIPTTGVRVEAFPEPGSRPAEAGYHGIHRLTEEIA